MVQGWSGANTKLILMHLFNFFYSDCPVPLILLNKLNHLHQYLNQQILKLYDSKFIQDQVQSHYNNQTLMKSILITLLLIIQTYSDPTYGFGLNTDSSTASATTTYTFGISLVADPANIIDIQSGASSSIYFPTDYTGRIPSGTVSCSLSGWGDPFASTIPTPSCSASGTIVTITNLFTQAYSLNYQFDFTLSINNIVNPLASGVTSNFFYYLYLSSGTVIITGTGIGISTSTMSCSISTTPTSVNENGYLNIQFLTPEFTSSSTIQINFNFYWPEANPKSTTIIPAVSNITCSPLVNAASSIACNFIQIGASNYEGTVSSIVTSAVSATSISFKFGTVKTPPTTMPQGSFLITAKNSGKTMSQCTSSVSGMTHGSLTTPQLSSTSTTVNSNSDLSLSFIVNTNIVSSDKITVTFPAQISLTGLAQIYIPSTNTYINGPTINGQTINVTGAVASSNTSLTLTFKQIVNPSSQLPTSTFFIETSRNQYSMDSLSTSLTYTATRAAISGASLTASNLQIGVSTTYTVQFTLGQPLTTGSAIVVGLPTAYQSKVGGCSPSCSVTSTKITFTNMATTIGSAISLTLTNVVNPTSIGVTTSLILYTLYNSAQTNSYVEYVNSGLSVNLVARVIPSSNIAISSNSQVVSFFPCAFTFAITNVNDLPANVYLEVYIPPEIGVSAAQINCQAGVSAVSCSYDSTTRKITFSSLSATSIAAGTLSSTPIVINNLINPSSTSPTSSFGVYLLNTLNQIVQYQTTGLTFTSTQAANFYSLNLIPNNTINSASTSLSVSFSITALSYLNSSLLVVTFPTKINIQLASCSPVSSNLASVSCSIISNKMQAILSYNSFSTSQATIFTISTYSNFPSLQPYIIAVDLYADMYQNSKLCTNANTPSSFQNTGVGTITVSSSSFSNPILLTTTNLNFQIASTSGFPFSYLAISFPAEFGCSAITCSLPSGITCTLQGNSVIINSTTTISLPLVAAINNLVTPSFSPSSNIYIQSFSSTGYLMDSNTQIYFQTSCTLPCKFCTSTVQPSSCTSCYSNTTLVQGQIYQNGTSCVSVCGYGLYLNSSTNSCVVCTSPCATCLSTAFCYSCVTNYYLMNGSCLSSCTFGYYGFNGLCLACSTAIYCQSCPNSYQCSSCISGYYFYNAQCYLTCPSLITYPNLVNRTCDSCPTNCTQCQGNSTLVTCVTCQTGYVLDSGRCYLTCVTSGLIAVSGICQSCSSPCSTCSILVSNCTSCIIGGTAPYLFTNRCLSSCPNGYYAQNSTDSCLLCTSPCQLCANISVHSCLSCITGYYLHGFDCLSVCPSTYYNTSGKCQSCVSPCLTCSGFSICSSCVNGTYLYGTQCLSQCPVGMAVVNGNQCLICQSVCKTCSSTSFCDSCYNSTYLYNGTCIYLCPSGTYANASTLVCENCISPCATCSNSTYCLSCTDTTKFQISGACVPCSSPCNTCSISISNCTSCLTSTSTPYIFSNGCLPTCPNNYYSDNVTYTCSICLSPCLTCNGSTNSSCTSCIGSYYLLSNLCLAVCPSTYYSNINICSACTLPCLTCSGSSICLSCSNGSYLYGSSCVGSCGSGLTTYNNSICLYCSVSCMTCLSANSSACTSCYSGAYLDQNSQTCSSTCSNGFYPDSSSGIGLCLPCVAPCLYCTSATYCLSCLGTSLFLVNGSCLGCLDPCQTCSTLRTNCTSCNTNSSYPYLYSASCNSNCLFGYFPDSSYQCTACTSPCASCTDSSTSGCLSCLSGYYRLNSTCFSVCPSAYFQNVIICSLCVSPCSTCSAASTCLSCENGYYLFGSSCVSNCSAGMAIINGNTCQYCSSSCLTCQSSNSSACTSCNPTTYLYSMTCSTTCPNSTYQDNTTSKCQPCISPCLLCQSLSFCLSCLDASKYLIGGSCVGCTSPCNTCSGSPTVCTSCSAVTGFPYLFNSTCASSCPAGYYGQVATGQCLGCVSPCQTCSSGSTTSCLSCINNYLLLLGSCLPSCPNSYYSNGLTCLGCPSPCQNCADNSTCITCQGGLLLEGSQCVSNCSSGLTVINSTYCSYCTGSCLSCLSSDTSACTSCYSGFYLLGTACYVLCPSTYYQDSSTSKCLACQNPCANCTSSMQCLSCLDASLFLVNSTCVECLSPCLTCSLLRTNCTSCDVTSSYKYLVNNTCLDSCPAQTYPNGLSCQACVSPCDTCLTASTSSCLTCLNGYLILNNTCLLGCPSGYYSNSFTCLACVNPCSTCSSSAICLSCIPGQYLLGSQCFSSCPGGMIITNTTNGGVCAYCASYCSTCLSSNSSYCTSCPNGTYLYLGGCVSNCSSGFFPNTVSSSCDLCSSPCATCTSPILCLSCLLPTDFLINFKCTGCQSPCLTCSGSITTCTTCNTTGTHPFFYQSNCLSSCPSTYYDSASYVCTHCQSPCYTCSGPGNQSCLDCLSGYLQLNNSCYLSCPTGYYNYSGYCLSCTSPCFTCVGPGTTACTACTSGLYLLGSNCVANCSGMATSGSSCVYCTSNCLTCQTSNNSYCTSCTSGLFLFNGACLTNCSAGYYQNSILSACMPCVAPCLLCSSSTSCLSCVDSTKFFVNSTCVGCSSPCYTCSLTVTNCTSCDSLSAFPILYQNSCVGSCPNTYYQATTTSCAPCTSPCNTCSGVGIYSCLTCVANTYMLNSSCYVACPIGFYQSVNSCFACTSPCADCQITALTCTNCISGYLLRGSSCVSNCSSGEVVVNGTYCQVCSSNCLTCLSSNYSYCTSCSSGTYLNIGICSITCPNSTFSDGTTNQCLSCISPCLTCSSLSYCTSCLSFLFLVGSTCQSCLSPCLTCSVIQTNCTSCNTSSTFPYLLSNGCLNSCPIGYYDGGSFHCLLCISPCSTCSAGTNRSCITCLPSYLQLGSDCYLVCPSGYYSNGTNCLGCNSSTCLTCILSPTTCLSCAASLFLYGSNCQGSCPIGMIVINGSICSSCTSNCLTCLTLNTSYCTSCYSNNYLFNGTCLTDCPTHYFADSSGNCIKCLSPCSTCQSISACLTCNNPLLYLQNFTCVSDCTYPLVGINSTCYRCSSQCYTCAITVSTCLLCSTGFYYFPSNFSCQLVCSYYVLPKNISSSGNNQCTQTCPAGTYADGSIHYCVTCPSACSLCISSTNCSQCNSGYSYYNYFCYDPCPVMAPYSVNSQCIMCNISNCQTCLNTTYCSVCVTSYLLISQGNASICIASCPSGQQYDVNTLNCITIPASPVNNDTNTANTVVESHVPPYTFVISSASLTFLLFLIKFKYPSSAFSTTMLLILSLACSAAMINLLSIEFTNSGINQGLLSEISVATTLILSAGGLQILSSLISLLVMAKIKDPQLVKLWKSNPISFAAIVILSAIDSNFILLTTSKLFDISVFQAQLVGSEMLKVIRFGLISNLFVKGLSIGYSAMQLLFYKSHVRLLTEAVSYPIQNSSTIQFLIISLIGLAFVIYLLCSYGPQQKEEQATKQESHQSLIDQGNAFDKRNESNAQIIMSIENSDMIVDINSLKDSKQISDVENQSFFFQQESSIKKKIKTKKVTPDEMLQEMKETIEQKIEDQAEKEFITFDPIADNGEELLFVQSASPHPRNHEKEQKDHHEEQESQNQEEQNLPTPKMLEPQPKNIAEEKNDQEKQKEKEELEGKEAERKAEQLEDAHLKLGDISQIVCKDVIIEGEKSKSNIFDQEQVNEEIQEKNKSAVIDFDKEEAKNNLQNQEKYSPSRVSKYQPNQHIVNQFAQHSYLDDANRFHEHQEEKRIAETNKITFEVENNDYEEGNNEVSFRKKSNLIQPEAKIVRPENTRQQAKRRQEEEIDELLKQDKNVNKVFNIEEEEQYKQTPQISTPIVNTFVEDYEETDFKPSQGLKGKRRRDNQRKPNIPLPKNETEKEIISIYHKKGKEKEKKQSRQRYPNIPRSTKNSNYIEYQMEDRDFEEENPMPKPIFSGEIKKDMASRYRRSIDIVETPLQEEDMPAKPSMKLRKSSFKKIGEMIVQGQHSARK